MDFKHVLCLVVFLHDIVLDLAVGAFASSSSMVGSEIAKLALSDKDKIHSWPRMKKMLGIKYYPLDCHKLLSYTKQDYFGREVYT